LSKEKEEEEDRGEQRVGQRWRGGKGTRLGASRKVRVVRENKTNRFRRGEMKVGQNGVEPAWVIGLGLGKLVTALWQGAEVVRGQRKGGASIRNDSKKKEKAFNYRGRGRKLMSGWGQRGCGRWGGLS